MTPAHGAENARYAVSVIIPHYNQPGDLKLCLESLARQNFPKEKTEIIVADNRSADEIALRKALAILPYAKLVFAHEKGAACSRNAAIAVSNGAALAFIDADCVADEAWLANGLKALEGADLVGGDVRVTVNRPEAPTPVELFERVFAFRQRMYIQRKHFSVTANLFARRAAAEAIGPFKNGVSEDVDWCLRARALGFRLAFNDTSIISHPARRTWEDLTRKWDRMIRERWNGFGGPWPVRAAQWAMLAAAIALSAAPHLAAILFSDRVRGWRQKVAAAGVLARIRIWRAGRMLSMLTAP
ncbi:MAG: glycosyltransferase [Pseudomonadota bacterium]